MYIWDPFQGVAVGSGAPSGWSFPGGGSGTVEAFSNGGAFPSHNFFSFASQSLQSPNIIPPDAGLTVWFAYKNAGFSPNGPIFQVWGASALGPPNIRMLQVKIEADGTLSFYVGGSPDTLIANSGGGAYAFPCGTWVYFQLNVSFDFITIGPTKFLRANAECISDGEIIISQTSAISNFYTDGSFASKSQAAIYVSWSQPNGSGQTQIGEPYVSGNVGFGTVAYPGNLWTIVLDAPGSGYHQATTTATVNAGDATLTVIVDENPASPTYTEILFILPAPASYLGNSYTSVAPGITITDTNASPGTGASAHATLTPIVGWRENQNVIEVATQPSTANVRIPQIPIEWARHPTTANLRINQIVIELPIKRSATASGWIVKEC